MANRGASIARGRLMQHRKAKNTMNQGTALITGASSGIGRELAKTFAARGHDVVLVARSRERLRALADELGKRHGVSATVIVADLSATDGPQKVFAWVRRRKIAIDVLVNNAGVMNNGEFSDIALSSHLNVLQVNVVASTVLTHLFVRQMVERGHGRILQVASMAGLQAIPRLGLYAASKAYMIHLSEALSEELAGTGVSCTVLCPGFTDTEILSQAPDTLRLPRFAIGSAADVARDGYNACMRGVPLYVSGLANQVAAQAVRYQPRWLARSIAGALARRNR
jgi:short-subunit dehydrogenase